MGDSQMNVDNPIPVMAYYYIWYDPQSWNRAKTDYPILGRYSSDDRSVMEQHIRWAKDAGIDGFIVSWKSTFKLDRRLKQLISVAKDEDFHLWIIYQGLDFERNPLPVEQIEADIAYFVKHYASDPVFGLVDRPVMILSGTWEFTPEEIEQIASDLSSVTLHLGIRAKCRGVPACGRLVSTATHITGRRSIRTRFQLPGETGRHSVQKCTKTAGCGLRRPLPVSMHVWSAAPAIVERV